MRLYRSILVCLAALVLAPAGHASGLADPPEARAAREKMVRDQILARGVSTPAVIDALRRVPRHWFVPENARASAYADHPLPIGEGQTISQPYVVALMTDVLGVKPSDRVLEIGTGSGYQAAVLSLLAAEVFTLEIKRELHERSAGTLKTNGYENVVCRHGDGYFGLEELAPFDAVMITAAVDHIPPPLTRQLKEGGRMVLPLGNPFGYQNLVLVTKRGDDLTVRQITGVLFVPLTGRALEKR